MKKMFYPVLGLISIASLVSLHAQAGENLLGYTQGAETLPEGAGEFYQKFTRRSDKGFGHYTAIDSETELEYGLTNKLSLAGAIKAMSIDTSGIVIDGYMPFDNDFNLKFSGIEVKAKYNFLSPALDDFGLSVQTSFDYLTVDPHSGQDKTTMSFGTDLLLQKYFMEGQLVWLGMVFSFLSVNMSFYYLIFFYYF